MRLLFVCTGNICRSPTAERLSVAFLAQRQALGLTVLSAGTQASVGHPVHHEAARALEHLGGDAEGFRARQLTPKLASSCDLIIAMTKAHRDNILERSPRLLRRTFTLAEVSLLASDKGAQFVDDLAALRPSLGGEVLRDVEDPIGREPEFFAAIAGQIMSLLPPVLDLCCREVALR
ncbi:protein tyrosine phosphatase [Mycolicibacterium iranicum]|uniref:Protein tyrosine phosphatase n=1 Tax=Mycolicibacterium iranicum TaxID=912594 RepID=A0A178LWX2_MYCIR|nr:protein tyrosine phosphatase [Mycolicibacterium iranicum]